MIPPPTPPDPADPAFCPACHWRGTFAQTIPEPDDVVRCPKCGVAVVREATPEQRAELEAALANHRGGSLKVVRERWYVFVGDPAQVTPEKTIHVPQSWFTGSPVNWLFCGVFENKIDAIDYVRLSMLGGRFGAYCVEPRLEDVP